MRVAMYCVFKGLVVEKMDEERIASEWDGKVFKCPACGMEINSFSAVCPACGSTIHSEFGSEAIKEFERKITESDLRIITESKLDVDDGRKRIIWIILNVVLLGLPIILRLVASWLGVVSLTPARKEKERIIKNHVFPDDYWVVSSALLFVKEQMTMLSEERFKCETVFWARVWNHKAKQLYEKAENLKTNDPVNRNAFDEVKSLYQKINDKHRSRAVSSAIIWLVLVAVIVVVAPWEFFPSQKWPSTGLATEIPQPMNMNTIKIEKSTSKEFRFNVYGSKTYVDIYVRNLKEAGFTYDSSIVGGWGYEAKNSKGHKVTVSVSNNRMTVKLTAK